MPCTSVLPVRSTIWVQTRLLVRVSDDLNCREFVLTQNYLDSKAHGAVALPLCTIALWKYGALFALSKCMETAAPPALSPNRVTRFGSPPNKSIFFRTWRFAPESSVNGGGYSWRLGWLSSEVSIVPTTSASLFPACLPGLPDHSNAGVHMSHPLRLPNYSLITVTAPFF